MPGLRRRHVALLALPSGTAGATLCDPATNTWTGPADP